MSKTQKSILIISLILIVDQVVKILIKTNMALGDEFPVFGNWFYIHFVENKGMAFGLEFAGKFGKIFLSLFRIVAVTAIGFYIRHLIIYKKAPTGIIVCMSMIFAGALGNIIDSAFYGLIFSDSYGRVAEFMPANGGYAPFLYGKVVDMLYFPLFETQLPKWLPIWGGENFTFFRPVFNIADSSITVGITMILIFYRKFFDEQDKAKKA